MHLGSYDAPLCGALCILMSGHSESGVDNSQGTRELFFFLSAGIFKSQSSYRKEEAGRDGDRENLPPSNQKWQLRCACPL